MMVNLNQSGAPSVDRAVRIFELLAHSQRGLTLSQISRTLALPKSSVYLIAGTLERNGYLQKNIQTGRYCFGLKLLSLSRNALENLDLRQVARPLLQKLNQETRLTVHLAILERGEAVIVDKVEAPGLVKLATWVGRRLDVNCSGVGKALLAFLSPELFDQYITRNALAKHNDRSLASIRALKKELIEVRRLGYAVDDEEDEIGLCCIGAPIFDSSREVVAALSVAGTVIQIPMERVSELGKSVRQTADTISSSLGFA